ncbi:MAG: autotransporter assembly complex protein TamA [Desulfuromonadaceae bacterium]|nr:autotransporter assembly complex protein TamA [Desulfuromonadaceae bacterium]MDD2846832.1 autotransporter assembly complex protein TamA [Desulfuromonadaceae bacterium]MDD4129190.1 autotransporter assembly complex protein TamA [Desulfuromonadaceae bacterium]
MGQSHPSLKIRLSHTECGAHQQKSFFLLLVLLTLTLLLARPLYAAEAVEIVVSGIEGAALKNVQAALTLPSGVVREGVVQQLWLQRFAQQTDEIAKRALEPFGYYNATVTTTIEPAGAGYHLLVKVEPGQAALLTTVSVDVTGPGSAETVLRKLVAAFPLQPGQVLLHSDYEAAKEHLKSAANDLGYLDADFSRHEIRVSRLGTTATIELLLETGEKFHFGPTSIQGANDFPQSYLRRHLAYREGDDFSFADLGETQRNFTNSERFKEVIITPERQDAAASIVPIAVKLKAAPRITVRPGIGYGTDTGARFTVNYRDLNAFHRGHEFYANLYLAERLQGMATRYVIPSPKDIRSYTTLLLNLQREDYSSYSSQIAAVGLERTRSLGKGKLGAAYITAQYEDYTVGDQSAISRFLLPGLRFSHDRFDDPVRPKRGFHYGLNLRGTHQALGSDTALLQLLAEGTYLVPLPWSLSLRTSAKTGTTLLSDPLKDIPASLRFFAGGDQSVRGYAYRSLGPTDATGKVVGGKQLFNGTVELERSLFADWGASVFYDAGNAFNSLSSFRLFQGAGVGLHYYTPVGALNLSLARPIGIDTPSFRIHLTVGFQF